MFDALVQWLRNPWRQDVTDERLLFAYPRTFNTVEGQVVLHDLIDKFYAIVAVVDNSTELARAEGRREPIHYVLEWLDRAEHPEKYKAVVRQG